MSSLSSGNSGDQIDLSHGSTEIFKSTAPVNAASGGSSWSVTLVLRDKPNISAPMAVVVWSEAGGCTNAGAVPASQRYAIGSVTVPFALLQLGTTLTVAGTGAAPHTFGAGERLCLSLNDTAGSGSQDVNFLADTNSLLGLSGMSRLTGPFNGG